MNSSSPQNPDKSGNINRDKTYRKFKDAYSKNPAHRRLYAATNLWTVTDSPTTNLHEESGANKSDRLVATTEWTVIDAPTSNLHEESGANKSDRVAATTEWVVTAAPITLTNFKSDGPFCGGCQATTKWTVTDSPRNLKSDCTPITVADEPTASSTSPQDYVDNPKQPDSWSTIPSTSSQVEVKPVKQLEEKKYDSVPITVADELTTSSTSPQEEVPKQPDSWSTTPSTSSQVGIKTPKQLDINWCEHQQSTSAGTTTSFVSPAFCSSISTDDKEKKPCAFFQNYIDKDCKVVINEKLSDYFLKVDTPEMNDLKNVPKFQVDNLPEVPGSLHTDVFKSVPINESNDELKNTFREASAEEPKGKGRRRSTRKTCFDRKLLLEKTLNYTSVLSADTTRNTRDIEIKKENEMLHQMYKSILGDKQLKVLVRRLPETDLLKMCSRKDISPKPQRKKRMLSKQMPKIRVSKRILNNKINKASKRG